MILRLLVLVTVTLCLPQYLIAQAAQSRQAHYLGKTASEWAIELASNDPARRRGAAHALGKCGPNAKGSVAKLRKALQDQEPVVREAVAFALGEIGVPTAQGALAELLHVLKEDKAPGVRRAAAYALGNFGEAAHEAFDPLREALKDEDPRVRQNAAWAIGRLGPEAIEKCVVDLSTTLQDGDALVRRDSASALGNGGEQARGAVTALVGVLRDESTPVRMAAANALGNMGPAARDAVPLLVKLVQARDADKDVGREALFALAKIGGNNLVQAIPALKQALSDPDPLLRKVVASAFANLAQDRREAQQAMPELLTALGDDDVDVRRNVAVALYNMRDVLPNKPDALPHLVKSIQNDPDREVRLFISRAFWDFELQQRRFADLRRALIDVALKDKEKLIRYQTAVLVATHLGAEAKDVTPSLIDFLKDTTITSVDKTTTSAQTSGKEGKTGSATVQESGTEDARPAAARALAHIGKAAGSSARKALEEAAEDPTSEKLRSEAKKALQSFR